MASKALKIIVYGSQFCPYCHKAAALFKKHNAPYTMVDTTTE